MHLVVMVPFLVAERLYVSGCVSPHLAVSAQATLLLSVITHADSHTCSLSKYVLVQCPRNPSGTFYGHPLLLTNACDMRYQFGSSCLALQLQYVWLCWLTLRFQNVPRYPMEICENWEGLAHAMFFSFLYGSFYCTQTGLFVFTAPRIFQYIDDLDGRGSWVISTFKRVHHNPGAWWSSGIAFCELQRRGFAHSKVVEQAGCICWLACQCLTRKQTMYR